MSAVRPAAVAGMFYPQAPGVLGAQVRAYLGQATQVPASAPRPKALIVPHAGYVYSGPIAAAAYARLAGLTGIRRVVFALREPAMLRAIAPISRLCWTHLSGRAPRRVQAKFRDHLTAVRRELARQPVLV